jgi:hypothetical protein
MSQRLGSNAQRLVNRTRLAAEDIPMRFREDGLVCKAPGEGPIPFHQDSVEHGSDRVGEMQWWLALDAVTPDMGAMRLLSGVHREGPLGTVLDQHGGTRPDLLELYPKLEELYAWSEPLSYEPGDATVHHGYTVHGSPGNTTDRARWSFIFAYTPSDTRWWHGRVQNWGSERIELSDDENPIVYPPPGSNAEGELHHMSTDEGGIA